MIKQVQLTVNGNIQVVQIQLEKSWLIVKVFQLYCIVEISTLLYS